MEAVEPNDGARGEVESFYDDFSRKFIEDIVQRNDRVARQLIFFSNAIPSNAGRILIIGFGSGECAYFISTRIADHATITGVDISSQNLRLAQSLFPHPRIEYRKLDVITEPLEGQWDVIVLPDVYEHIPIESRAILHSKVNRGLTANGRVLLTIPSPGKQDSLRALGRGLQVIDETVTLNDLILLANDVGGSLTYFNMISVWETDDYIHAVIERGAQQVQAIREPDMIPLKGWPKRTVWTKGKGLLADRLYLSKLQQALRRRRIQSKLRRRAAATTSSR
jgi:SAM-dependent methyltransferase